MGVFKQTFAQLQAFFDKHDKVLVKQDVINNLTSDNTDKPLSAAQGKALKDAIPQPYTLQEASDSTLGGIKIGFSETGKKYAVKLEGGKACVEVPWSDTNTTYQKATDTTLGLVKTGYTTSGKNYAAQLDSDGKMFVNVPWEDNNTTYVAATTSQLGLVKQCASVAKPINEEAASIKVAVDAIIDVMKASGQMA